VFPLSGSRSEGRLQWACECSFLSSLILFLTFTLSSSLASAAAVGSTVLPIFIKKVIPIVGYAWTMRIIAFASAIILSGCFFLIKTRLPPRKVKAPRFWIDLDAFKVQSYTLHVIGATAIMSEFCLHLLSGLLLTLSLVYSSSGHLYPHHLHQ
jgi:hypothetical protein